MSFPQLSSAVLLLALSWPAWLCAQTPPLNSAASAVSGDRYPDQGYLSDARYTNQYFGFSFDLPPDAHLRPVHRPVAPDGHIQLLELEGATPQHAIISLTAYARAGKNDPNAKQMLRKELDNELFYGVEELRGLSKTVIGKQQFYFYETRRGIDQHYSLAADLDGYVLHVVLAGRDDKLVGQLNAAFATTRFFSPDQALQNAGPDAKPYEGPAMSSHRLALLRRQPPSQRLDPGTISGDEYRNNELGLQYFLPPRWLLGTEPAVQREVERVRQINSDGPALGRAEAELVRACEKVLFSAWKEPPGPNGRVAYDSFGEVTLSAMSMACFPDMKFPSSISDAAEVKAFLVQYSLTHPLMRETRQGRAFERNGQIFILTEGVIAFQVEGDALSRRISIAMLITQHRGYLLTWFFAAPHESELRELMNAKLTLEPEPTRNRAGREVTEGGGTPTMAGGSPEDGGTMPSPNVGADAAASSATSAAPAAAVQEPASSSNTGGKTGSDTPLTNDAPASNSSSAAQPSTDPAAQSSQRPTLLRPGETMNDQQPGGTPLPKKH